MYFSVREKKILALLLEYPNGVALTELQDLLQVSKRTIYREIASLEKTIQALDVKIIKPRGAGYRIVGDSKDLNKLLKNLDNGEKDWFTDNVMRQSAIVCSLLLEDEEETIEALSYDFAVSTTTITNDLQTIEISLASYRLELIRLKGRGIRIVGRENERRQLLSNLIYNGISEYDFFNFLDHSDQTTENYFFTLLSTESLHQAESIFDTVNASLFERVADNQMQRILIILALSIDRIKIGHMIESDIKENPKPESMQLASQIMVKVATEVEKNITSQEVRFLAHQLEGVNYKKPHNIFIDSFDVELSYKTRELIRLVAEDTGYSFYKDEQLFIDLLAHMTAALKRSLTVIQGNNNTVLRKVMDKYKNLTVVVTEKLAQIFTQHHFTFDELGYVVIHFATSLERYPSGKKLSTLVLCSSGVGTSRILESRLNKYVPEIQKVRAAKISEMNHLNFNDYDLILSTVFLPGFELSYKVISPLLLDDEIREIKDYIRDIQPEEVLKLKSNELLDSSETFDEIYATMRVANNLLRAFDVKQIKGQETIEATLAELIESLSGTIVKDAKQVTSRVIERYLVAPIGIPNTNFALFHTVTANVIEPYFAIYDLDCSYLIQGMDKKSIELTRILLLLAPDPIPTSQVNLLGKISSSIIESDLNTEIYKYGNKEIIYQLLSSLFVKEIREN